MKEGEVREVQLHDGSVVILKNLDKSYDPTSRFEALRVMEEAQRNNWLVTGLLYLDPNQPSLTERYNLVDTPLNRLADADLRPSPDMMKTVNDLMF
jgi:2-oxoglutarate/2-oxoacid ferredoxin oxidoreductase subunit beta